MDIIEKANDELEECIQRLKERLDILVSEDLLLSLHTSINENSTNSPSLHQIISEISKRLSQFDDEEDEYEDEDEEEQKSDSMKILNPSKERERFIFQMRDFYVNFAYQMDMFLTQQMRMCLKQFLAGHKVLRIYSTYIYIGEDRSCEERERREERSTEYYRSTGRLQEAEGELSFG